MDSVVIECLDEIERLRELVDDAIPFVAVGVLSDHEYMTPSGKIIGTVWIARAKGAIHDT